MSDKDLVGVPQVCCKLVLSIPNDVGGLGCDDIRLANLVTPALTTLWVDKQALGRRIVTLLLERLAGAPDDTSFTLKPELVVRASAP